jgi:hypothetical protein
VIGDAAGVAVFNPFQGTALRTKHDEMATTYPLLAITTERGWKPGIGDPTFLGWLTVVAYFTAALMCWKAAAASRGTRWPDYSRGEPLFWVLCAFFLICLGINKQLDLQTWFTITGKRIARNTGWYEQRRFVQAGFIAVLALLGFVIGIIGLSWTRRFGGPYRLAFAGGVFLGAFIIIRAASFHHVDRMLGFRLAGLRMNVILELGGIICIGSAAWSVVRQKLAVPKGAVRAAV